MDNKQELIYSAFASLFIYIILILSFLLYLKTPEVKKINAVVKNTVLQLDIILKSEQKVKEKITIKSTIQNKKIAKKVVKKNYIVEYKTKK